MELQWNSRPCTYLRSNVCPVSYQEQTQEIRLPEGMPDIGRVLCAWGQPVVRTKEWRNDGVSVSGGISASVLYLPEDGSGAQSAQCWIPFQTKWSVAQAKREGSIQVRCLLRSIDARTLSARKMMVRASVGLEGAVLEPTEAKVYVPGQVPAGVELLKRTYPMELVKEAGEKQFFLEEEVKIPGVQKWLFWQIRPRITEQNVVGSRAVFRGIGLMQYVYMDDEGNIQNGSQEIPFAQFADLDRDYDKEATLDVVMEISSLEPEITPDGARIQCGLNAQYKVWDRELLEVAEDAYSPAFDMEVNRQTLNLPALLDNKEETLDARMDFQAGDLVDVQFLPDFPSQYREGESISMEFPAQFITLYRDEEGNLQCAAESWTGNASIPAGENCRVTAALTGWHPLDASGREQRINLRLHTTANQDIEQITGLSIGDRKEVKEGRPSLILRRMDADSLWEFAKASGSTVDAIRKANQLETEPDAGQMLLIPIP